MSSGPTAILASATLDEDACEDLLRVKTDGGPKPLLDRAAERLTELLRGKGR